MRLAYYGFQLDETEELEYTYVERNSPGITCFGAVFDCEGMEI